MSNSQYRLQDLPVVGIATVFTIASIVCTYNHITVGVTTWITSTTAVPPKFLATLTLSQPGGKFCPVYIGAITPEFFPRLHPWREVTFSLLCVYIFLRVSLQKISGYILPRYYLNYLRTTQCADAIGTFWKISRSMTWLNCYKYTLQTHSL